MSQLTNLCNKHTQLAERVLSLFQGHITHF